MPQLCHSSAVISLADCDEWATSVCIAGTASPFASHTCVMCWVCTRKYVSTVSSFCFTCPPACRGALCAAPFAFCIFAPCNFCACTLDGSESQLTGLARLSPSELDLHADRVLLPVISASLASVPSPNPPSRSQFPEPRRENAKLEPRLLVTFFLLAPWAVDQPQRSLIG